MTRNETAHRLCVDKGIISVLIDRGVLVEITTPFGSNGTRNRVTIASIEDYERQRAGDGGLLWVSLEEAAGQLDIPLSRLRPKIGREAAVGRLRARKNNPTSTNSPYTHIAEEDLAAWRARLKIPEGYVGSQRAKELAGGITQTTLRTWRDAGRLRTWTDGKQRGAGERLWYSVEDLTRIVAEQAKPSPEFVRLTEALREFRIGYSVVQPVLDCGRVEHVRRPVGPHNNMVWVHREQLRVALARQGVPSGYISASQAAGRHGIAVGTIHNWARTGQIKALKVDKAGDRWYVSPRSLQARLRGRPHGSTS